MLRPMPPICGVVRRAPAAERAELGRAGSVTVMAPCCERIGVLKVAAVLALCGLARSTCGDTGLEPSREASQYG